MDGCFESKANYFKQIRLVSALLAWERESLNGFPSEFLYHHRKLHECEPMPFLAAMQMLLIWLHLNVLFGIFLYIQLSSVNQSSAQIDARITALNQTLESILGQTSDMDNMTVSIEQGLTSADSLIKQASSHRAVMETTTRTVYVDIGNWQSFLPVVLYFLFFI